jgi:hypothetical protein
LIRQLLQYAKQARRIELDQERIAFFIYQAIEVKYDQHQFERAKLWIMYGEWKFRGVDPSLQWDDLFPTDDQVKDAIARTKTNMVLIDHVEYNKKIRSAYQAGYNDGQKNGMVKMSPEQVNELKGIISKWTE